MYRLNTVLNQVCNNYYLPLPAAFTNPSFSNLFRRPLATGTSTDNLLAKLGSNILVNSVAAIRDLLQRHRAVAFAGLRLVKYGSVGVRFSGDF